MKQFLLMIALIAIFAVSGSSVTKQAQAAVDRVTDVRTVTLKTIYIAFHPTNRPHPPIGKSRMRNDLDEMVVISLPAGYREVKALGGTVVFDNNDVALAVGSNGTIQHENDVEFGVPTDPGVAPTPCWVVRNTNDFPVHRKGARTSIKSRDSRINISFAKSHECSLSKS